MNRLILGLAAAVCISCMSPHEGEFAHVANVELEGMAWRVQCEETTQRKLNERLIEDFRRIEIDELTSPDPRANNGRFYVASIRDHYWASVELAGCRQ